MPSSITALTELAVSNYPTVMESPLPKRLFMQTGDAVLDGLLGPNFIQVVESDLDRAIEALSGESDLAPLLSAEDASKVMITYNGYGMGTNGRGLISSLLAGAARRMFIFGPELSQSSFVGLVLENYEELKRAIRGEQVRAYRLTGFSRIKLDEAARVETPWGTLYPAPANIAEFAVPVRYNLPETTVILAKAQLITLSISSEPNPDIPPPDQDQLKRAERARQLLPLAFALATTHTKLCVPLATFELVMPPFGTGLAWSNMPWFFPVHQPVAPPSAAEMVEAEVWSRRLDQNYPENLQVAGRRIISAIAQRADVVDSLIDAVTAWESMVGTRTETSFRVTAALAKLLERDSSKRLAFRKELGEIYNLRSRVVHGDPVDLADVAIKTSRAIEIGLKTLSAIYSKPTDWLAAKSNERADRLILED